MPSGIVTSFLGALQASISVLLTIAYGVIAAQFKLLSEASSKEISKTCVRLFLPALLIHNVGSQLHLDTGLRYVPILIWSILYNILSMGLGLLLVKVFKLPHWVTPAIAFNNTTSLPLLLVQSLSATGILSSLLTSPNDSMSDAIERAKSYFLVNAMIGNSLTFAIGPALLNGHEEDAPDTSEDKHDSTGQNGRATDGANDVEQARDRDHREEEEENERSHERAPLLVNHVIRASDHAARVASRRQSEFYESLPPWAQKALSFSYQFLNAPVIGAVIGAVIGLTPPLHRVFFNSTENGGYLNAWLTTSIKNIGDLFAALQVIVVGVKLSQSMVKMKRGEESGSAPWLPMVIITFVRLVLWPAISIPLIYALATKTQTLDKDPILWFAMMLMPVGPPALKLAALADVNGSGEKEKMSIAKFLTISYVLSPLICFAIVGSLSASEAATAKM
ncbi:MAG: hypothetical protein M1821_005461 [Bathelium mastoideum]|nr:MAG: hypothetical protein M1821_005461 [Bathelium mastoideum]